MKETHQLIDFFIKLKSGFYFNLHDFNVKTWLVKPL